jgi:transposase
VLLPRQRLKLARGAKDKEQTNPSISVVGIDIGKNSFHVVGLDQRGAIVRRQKWPRGQVEARFANMPPCLIGMEACVGAHHLSRRLKTFGHDARLMPARYVRPYSKGQKNDFRDAEAIAEAVQRPTMKFVVTKTADQLDLQSLHRIRERLVMQKIVQRMRKDIGLPVEFTLDACRHGGMTELEEAELTDGQGRALSAHRTRESYAGYAKRTAPRILAATRKRRAPVLANQTQTEFQNEQQTEFQNKESASA